MEIDKIRAEFSDYNEIVDKIGIKKIEKRYHAIKKIYCEFIKQMKLIEKKDVSLNDRVLMHAILDYYTDITRLKDFHHIDAVNRDKIIAYEISWLLRRKPIQVIKDDNEALVYINEKFLLGILANHLLVDKLDEIIENKTINAYFNILFYFLKYRNCDPKNLEIIISSFKAGNSIDKIDYD